MTEHNLFQEVQEDLERQKLEALWKQYGLWVIIVALGIVLATASSTAYRSWKADHDQHLTAGLLTAARTQKDTAKSLESLQKYADENGGASHAAFALLRAGSLAAEQNDKAKAIGFFDKAAGEAKADPAFRQLGDLMSVQLQMDDGDAAALMQRLQPLTEEHAAWRFSAMEEQGYLALRAGDKVKAKQLFTDLSQNARVPSTISERAADIVRSLD